MLRALAIYILAIEALFLNSASIYALDKSTGPNGSNAQAVHALGDIGAGVNVGIISVNNTRITHEAFRDSSGISHAFWNNATGDGAGYIPSSHDTWIAGIVASRGGISHPNDIGVAPGVNIYSERVVTTAGGLSSTYLENALDDLVSRNCHIIFTGFLLDDPPDGTSIWTRIYDYYADTYNIVFANPAGNYDATANPANKVAVFGDGYNGITTGGLAVVEPYVWRRVGPLSSIGLTADGRRKPDIVAPSQNQTMPSNGSDTNWLTWTSAGGETSFSTPHTAGVAALLIAYSNSISEPNHNEVIRAIIVNSAFPNIRDNNNISTAGQLFNVARGCGRIDALRAYQTLATGPITAGSHTTAMKGWAYENVKRPSSPDIYYVMGTQNQRLIVTLAWNRTFLNKYTANPLANLNLTILDPNGTFTRFSDTGIKDNLKKCDILLPHTGEYQIKISPGSTLNVAQNYGLAFEILSPIAGDLDLNYIVDFKDLSAFTDQWLLTGTGLSADLAAPAGHVDFADFAILAQNWLTANNAYYAGY